MIQKLFKEMDSLEYSELKKYNKKYRKISELGHGSNGLTLLVESVTTDIK